MPKVDWTRLLPVKGPAIQAWDIPMAAYAGAKFGMLITLAHHLYHFTHDTGPDETFLTHRLIELVGVPCAGVVIAASFAALHNRRLKRR